MARGPPGFLHGWVVLMLSLWHMVLDVAVFWRRRLAQWWARRSPVDLWLEALANAECFEDWEEAAMHLDSLLGLDLWRDNPVSPYYDYRLIQSRVQLVAAARSSTSQPTNSDAVAPSCTTPTTPGGHRRHHPHHHPDAAHTAALVNLLRSGLVRNLGNITSPKLYNRAFAGTKYLIEEYVYQVCNAVETIATLPTTAAPRHHHHQPTLQLALPSTPTPSLLQPTGAPQQQQAAASLGATATTQTLGVHAPHPHQHALHYHQHLHDPPHLPTQAKLDLIHDTRQSFGRSTLVLQGGALFGLVHLGVVKALFLRGLLPRIITGSATGALVAALVACHTEDELPAVLRGDGIDLSAFAGRRGGDNDGPETLATRLATLKRRVRRFWTKGYFLDVKVLEECVQANIGDITFMEAYLRSRRILNITVGPTKQGGPMLLNYLTAPYVLIWTAAVASNASTPTLYGHRETTILCKDVDGRIVPWIPANAPRFSPSQGTRTTPAADASTQTPLNGHVRTPTAYATYPADEVSPLLRVAELFNVNFFIVSQARPYLIPFLRSDVDGPDISSIRRSIARRGRRGAAVSSPSTLASLSAFLARVVGLEIRHRLRQLDTLRLLPLFLRRLLVDDWIPGSGSGSVTSAGGSSGIGFGAGGLGSGVGGNCITLVPRVTAGDFLRLLLETPRRDTLDAWILRGQRSVWPAVAALRVRCAVEVELERAYQRVRTLKPGRGGGGGAGGGGSGGGPRGRGPAPIPGAQEGTTMNSLRTAANDAAAADHSGVAGTGAGTTVGPTQRRRWTDGQIEEGHAE